MGKYIPKVKYYIESPQYSYNLVATHQEALNYWNKNKQVPWDGGCTWCKKNVTFTIPVYCETEICYRCFISSGMTKAQVDAEASEAYQDYKSFPLSYPQIK